MGCRDEFRAVTNPCLRCGLEQPVRQCPQERQPWLLSSVIAPLRYEYPLSVEIQALKFSRRRSYGRAFGLILEEHLRGRPEIAGIDAIVAVPLHRRRLYERGYNQALELARTLNKRLSIPIDSHCCRRIRNTPSQTDIPTKQRKANVRGAFDIPTSLNYRHIVIVDDVITTGSTVNELARLFSKAGVERIHVYALARAGAFPV